MPMFFPGSFGVLEKEESWFHRFALKWLGFFWKQNDEKERPPKPAAGDSSAFLDGVITQARDGTLTHADYERNVARTTIHRTIIWVYGHALTLSNWLAKRVDRLFK